MRRKKLAAALLVAAIILTAGAVAFGGVAGTKHDLSLAGNSPCMYCHTPHQASTAVQGYLWNIRTSSTGFTMYSGGLHNLPSATPSDVSLLCLSCHDATIGMGFSFNHSTADFLNGPGTVDGNVHCETCHTGIIGVPTPGHSSAGIATGFYIGKDLSNDHPISFTYPTAIQNPEIVQPAGGRVGVLPLYGGRMECATCHDPHNATITPFLRVTQTASALCFTCHIK